MNYEARIDHIREYVLGGFADPSKETVEHTQAINLEVFDLLYIESLSDELLLALAHIFQICSMWRGQIGPWKVVEQYLSMHEKLQQLLLEETQEVRPIILEPTASDEDTKPTRPYIGSWRD